MSQSKEATSTEQKYYFAPYNPQRLEDMRIYIGTVAEIEEKLKKDLPWPQSEWWIKALKEHAEKYERTGVM